MRILVDTHYVLWAAVHSNRMEPWARNLMGDLNNEIFVSAASIYEISLKVRNGKLHVTVVCGTLLLILAPLKNPPTAFRQGRR